MADPLTAITGLFSLGASVGGAAQAAAAGSALGTLASTAGMIGSGKMIADATTATPPNIITDAGTAPPVGATGGGFLPGSHVNQSGVLPPPPQPPQAASPSLRDIATAAKSGVQVAQGITGALTDRPLVKAAEPPKAPMMPLPASLPGGFTPSALVLLQALLNKRRVV